MTNFIKTQNSFSHGEVAPEFFARDDINGLAKLENMDVVSGGGLRRRCGTVPVAPLTAPGRLISFSVSESENYLLALSNGHIYVYQGTQKIQDLLMPWPNTALDTLQYAQRFGTMIFVHPDYKPRTLSKGAARFELNEFDFARNDSDLTVKMPFMRFDDSEDVGISVTAHASGNNYATFTTTRAFWTADNVGGRLVLMGRQWLITQYVSSTVVVAHTNGAYSLPGSTIYDWREAAFGTRRGWPRSITFHQDRLVFGGSRAWPAGVWMSQVGRHSNFDAGTGLDDEAIFITLLSAQRQQICTVVSSDNLQILTSVGEWAISNKPLTPSSVDIKQHTNVGSVDSRYLPPQRIEGATVFISRSMRDIRELALDELGEHYNANDLCALAKHLMKTPVDIAYNEDSHQLFVVMSGGEMAVLNQNSALGISAWGTYKTNGKFISVAVVGSQTYVMTHRGTSYAIERFDSTALTDAGNLGFSFSATALPHRMSGHNAGRIRVRRITARVLNTKSLFINDMRADIPNRVYSGDSTGFSGDLSVNFLGTQASAMDSPWRISGSEQLPATILSVTMYGYCNV